MSTQSVRIYIVWSSVLCLFTRIITAQHPLAAMNLFIFEYLLFHLFTFYFSQRACCGWKGSLYSFVTDSRWSYPLYPIFTVRQVYFFDVHHLSAVRLSPSIECVSWKYSPWFLLYILWWTWFYACSLVLLFAVLYVLSVCCLSSIRLIV